MMANNVYIHDPNIAYPDKDFAHMVQSPKVHDYVYDDKFPYRLTDAKSKFMRFIFRAIILIIVKPFIYFRYLLRIKGKKIIESIVESPKEKR